MLFSVADCIFHSPTFDSVFEGNYINISLILACHFDCQLQFYEFFACKFKQNMQPYNINVMVIMRSQLNWILGIKPFNIIDGRDDKYANIFKVPNVCLCI